MNGTDPGATPRTTRTRFPLSRHRSLLGGALVAALLIAGISTWSQRAVQRTLKDRLRSELKTALDANVTALDLWIQGQLRTATLVAADPEILQPARTVLAQPQPSPTNGPDAGRFGPFRPGSGRQGPSGPDHPELGNALDERLKILGYQAAVLVGTNGRVVAGFSRMRLRPGTSVPADHLEIFQRVVTSGKPALVTPFKPARPMGRGGPGRPPAPGGEGGPGDPNSRRGQQPPRMWPGNSGPPGELQVMQVLAPIRAESGEVTGVLAFILRPEAEFTRVLSVARPGASGETFAFAADGRLLSQSRFDDQLRSLGLLTNGPNTSSALNLVLRDPGGDVTRGFKPANLESNALMRLVSDAHLATEGVSVDPVRDYRGVPVVGAWHWVEEHQFGVVTKIDADEAFQPLRVLRLISFILLLIVGLATLAGLVGTHLGSVWRRRFDEAQLRARQLGQYTLIEKIGEGAMGVVYRAHHALLRRETAVKLLLPDRADDDLIRQFEHEVQLTCQLTHPNTVQIFDYGHTADGIFYYAMELLHGMTLQELVERHGAQPEERVIHLLRQAAESLREAHDHGLIHRDIKPGNLFLCERGGQPDTVKVLDFGLVRDVRQDPPESAGKLPQSRFLGTPLYMAPETIRTPGHGTPSSDLYALGAVAYLLVTGEPVFVGDSVDAIWQLHATANPVPPRQRASIRLSPELEALILACLAKDPSDRPASMSDFIQQLDACPVATAWTSARRRDWWNRHVGSATAAAAATPQRAVEATLRIDLAGRSADNDGSGSRTDASG